jgi:hypothetical protein
MEEMINAYKILVRKPEGKRPQYILKQIFLLEAVPQNVCQQYVFMA